MPIEWEFLRNKAKLCVLPGAGLLLIMEVAYHRRYVRLEDSPLRIALDAPEWFNIVWTALLVVSGLLVLVTLPKWQSLIGLLLICAVIALRTDVP